MSKDGKWAASGTYLYDAQTLAPVKELPALSVSSEFTADSKSLVMFDVVTQCIVIMPASK